jgi:hypothetical protein
MLSRRISTFRSLGFAALASLACAAATGALAQAQVKDPNMPDPKTTVPEKIDPPLNQSQSGSGADTTGTIRGRTLSDQLNKSDGVIKPPSGTDPGIAAPAPVPNPGTTPVIPPPGSPGGNPSVDPK